MLAIVVSDDHLIALAAIVPSAITCVVAVLAWRANHHAKAAAESVKPNGSGTAMDVLETLLAGQRRTHLQLQTLQLQQDSHEVHDDDRFAALQARIDLCEARHGSP